MDVQNFKVLSCLCCWSILPPAFKNKVHLDFWLFHKNVRQTCTVNKSCIFNDSNMFYLICGLKLPLESRVCIVSTLSSNSYLLLFLQLKHVTAYKNSYSCGICLPHRMSLHCNYCGSLHMWHDILDISSSEKLLEHVTPSNRKIFQTK